MKGTKMGKRQVSEAEVLAVLEGERVYWWPAYRAEQVAEMCLTPEQRRELPPNGRLSLRSVIDVPHINRMLMFMLAEGKIASALPREPGFDRLRGTKPAYVSLARRAEVDEQRRLAKGRIARGDAIRKRLERYTWSEEEPKGERIDVRVDGRVLEYLLDRDEAAHNG